MERTEPTELMERTEPTELMERTEPTELEPTEPKKLRLASGNPASRNPTSELQASQIKPEDDPAFVFDFADDQSLHNILVAVAGITAIGVGAQSCVPVPAAVPNNPAQSAAAIKQWLDALATQRGLIASNFTSDYRSNRRWGMFDGLGPHVANRFQAAVQSYNWMALMAQNSSAGNFFRFAPSAMAGPPSPPCPAHHSINKKPGD